MSAGRILKTIDRQKPLPETNLMLLIRTMESLDASEERKFKHFLLAWLCDVTPAEQWRIAIENAMKVAKR